MLMRAHWQSGIHMACLLVLMCAYDCSWKVVRRSLEHSWAWGHGAMSTHESSKTVMSMVPWGNGHSLLLMSAHCAIAPYLWVLMSAYECLWELMRVHECWTASWKNKQKMFTFKMVSLLYFANILVQISLNNKKLDIFKIFTKWAVEKSPRWNFYVPRKPVLWDTL